MRPPRKLWHLFPAAHQEKWVLEDIREHMAWFGYPLDGLTDEEIKDSVIKLAGIGANFGVSVKQAVDAVSALGRMTHEKTMESLPKRSMDDGHNRE